MQIIKIANRVCNNIRFCVFLSVCCPRSVTNLSEDSIKLDAIGSISFLTRDWSVVVLVVAVITVLASDGNVRSFYCDNNDNKRSYNIKDNEQSGNINWWLNELDSLGTKKKSSSRDNEENNNNESELQSSQQL